MRSARDLLALAAVLVTMAAFGAPDAAGQESTWRPASDMPTARSGFAAAVIDGRVYAAGGRDERGRALDVLERFDATTGEWETLRSMPTARFDAAAVAFRGQLIVLGGRAQRGQGQGRSEVLDVVEVYDPARDEWREVDELEEEREGHVAFILRDTLFAVGGSNQRQEILGSIEFLPLTGDDVDDLEWKVASSLRLIIPRAAMAVAVVRGRAFAFGGFTPVPVNFVHEFRNSRFQVDLPAGPFRARGAHAAVAVGDTILLLGGRGPGGASTDDRPVLADVDYFLTSNGEWRKGPAMLTARESFAAVAVGSSVYAIGGRGRDGEALRSVEVLNLSTGTAVVDPAAPPDFFLRQNAPNPFGEQTQIEFGVGGVAGSSVVLEVFDLQGRRVRTLVDEPVSPGVHRVAWDGRSGAGARLAAGVYLYRLTQGAQMAYRKLVLVR